MSKFWPLFVFWVGQSETKLTNSETDCTHDINSWTDSVTGKKKKKSLNFISTLHPFRCESCARHNLKWPNLHVTKSQTVKVQKTKSWQDKTFNIDAEVCLQLLIYKLNISNDECYQPGYHLMCYIVYTLGSFPGWVEQRCLQFTACDKGCTNFE